MKKIRILAVLFVALASGFSYGQGIQFKHLTLEEALLEAKQENKLIFIDFHTVWCAPCRGMEKKIFPDEQVGEFYNKSFINLELDAENEGKAEAAKYKVNVFPTFLFINAEGKVVHKSTGAKDVEKFIALGQDAVAALNDDYSLLNLKQMYPSRQDDEDFLSMYIDKMIEYRESPADAIEAWLKVQTSIKENDVDMMEFLFNYKKYLIIGGKAEEIFRANYDEFWDICTLKEEATMKRMIATMVNNTKELAYSRKDANLMRTYITNWKKLSDFQYGNLAEFEMEYSLLAKDVEAFKKQDNAYIDSIMSAKSLEQIRTEDKASYEEYKKKMGRPTMFTKLTFERYETGVEAMSQKEAIEKTGKYYLRYCEGKKDYKKLLSWIDYASELTPNEYSIDSFRGDVLYKKGDVKNAIKYKEAAISKLGENNLHKDGLKKEIQRMKSGETL